MNLTKSEIIEFRLHKSQQDMLATKALVNIQGWGGVINRLYYASFHTVSALLYQNELRAKSHTGIKTLLEMHSVKTDLLSVNWSKFYTQLFNDRNNSDCEDFAVFTEDDVLPLVPQTEEFIDVIKRLISQ